MFRKTYTRRPSVLRVFGKELVVETPYDAALVASIKGLPFTERRYDANLRVWIVDPKHSVKIAQWIEDYIGDRVSAPPLPASDVVPTEQTLIVRYVGRCKERMDGSSSAYGLVGMDWSIVFPEQVLRNFFGGSVARPGEKLNYFALLGLGRSASTEEVGQAFRRLAKLWHPDVCKEVDAAEIFMRIKAAYDTLKDEDKRNRYEAGLAFEAMINPDEFVTENGKSVLDETPVLGYRAPLRSGLITVQGLKKVSGKFEVSKILSWDDVIDAQGRTLITSWPSGAKEPVEEWL